MISNLEMPEYMYDYLDWTMGSGMYLSNVLAVETESPSIEAGFRDNYSKIKSYLSNYNNQNVFAYNWLHRLGSRGQ